LAEFDTLDGGSYWRCSRNILNLKIKGVIMSPFFILYHIYN
jgi:hypothetical protein